MQPWSASFRKQMRQMPNLRYTARGRPQSMQRCTCRVENLGGRLAAAIFDLLAILVSSAGGPGGAAIQSIVHMPLRCGTIFIILLERNAHLSLIHI